MFFTILLPRIHIVSRCSMFFISHSVCFPSYRALWLWGGMRELIGFDDFKYIRLRVNPDTWIVFISESLITCKKEEHTGNLKNIKLDFRLNKLNLNSIRSKDGKKEKYV